MLFTALCAAVGILLISHAAALFIGKWWGISVANQDELEDAHAHATAELRGRWIDRSPHEMN